MKSMKNKFANHFGGTNLGLKGSKKRSISRGSGNVGSISRSPIGRVNRDDGTEGGLANRPGST